MIDHTGVNVEDFEASREFYAAALVPLGYELLLEFHGTVAGFGEAGKPDFPFSQGEAIIPRVHVAFWADTRREVETFYEAALGAGGRENGAPGSQPHYHPDYYAAFVLDPDGHNVEAVCHMRA